MGKQKISVHNWSLTHYCAIVMLGYNTAEHSNSFQTRGKLNLQKNGFVVNDTPSLLEQNRRQ